MIVLGLDGAIGGFSAAVARDGRIVSERRLDGQVALEAGLGALVEALAAAKVSPRELDRLAVGVGPGGFTGLRITVTYAKALAQGWNLPLVGISSFDALEFGRDLDPMLTAVAGRPGIISARYRRGAETRRASGPTAAVIAELLGDREPETLNAIGAPEDVLRVLAEARWTVTSMAPLVTPPAAAVALAGASARPAASAHDVIADYGEAPAVRVPSFRPTPRAR
jgi:tRNA threonylcarbamoyladenosine biosynthesis protein TsaB